MIWRRKSRIALAISPAARNLLQSVRIKILAREVGLESITVRQSKFELRFLEGRGIDVHKYAALHQKYVGKISYRHARGGQLQVEKLKGTNRPWHCLRRCWGDGP